MQATARAHPAHPAEAPPGEPRVWRSAAVGAAVGFLGATAAVAGGGLAAGLEAGAAVGLGMFVGMWGGAGFGFMLGATIPLGRELDADHRREAGR